MPTKQLPPLDSGVKPLDDFIYVMAPPPLQAASIEYARAWQKLREVKQVAKQAADAVKAGIAADQFHALEAARAGKTNPTPKAASRAREAAEKVAAEAQAVARVAQEALAVFVDQLIAYRDELDRAAAEAIEATRTKLAPVVDEIEADLLRLYGLRSLRNELAIEGGLTSRRPAFDPRMPRRLDDVQRKWLNGLREMLDAERLAAERVGFLTERASIERGAAA